MIKKLYLDVETTGLNPETAGLTQMACILEIDGVEVMSANFDIKPFDGAEISKRALEVTGKTYDEIMTYPDEGKVLIQFMEMLKVYINPMVYGDDFTLIAYNAEFDQNFMIAWFERQGKKYANYINYRKCDPLALLRILHVEGIANLKGYKLSEVYEAIFGETFKAHDADADIKATVRVHKYLIEHYIRDPRGKKPTGYEDRPHTEDMGR